MLASGLPWERGVRDAAVPTTPDSPLIFSFVEPFAFARLATTAGFIVLVTALACGLRVTGLSTVRLLATKVPTVVLGAVIPALIEGFRRRHERGFVLLQLWTA